MRHVDVCHEECSNACDDEQTSASGFVLAACRNTRDAALGDESIEVCSAQTKTSASFCEIAELWIGRYDGLLVQLVCVS